MPIDQRHRLDDEVFSYRVSKDRKVFIFWHGKQIMILKDVAAAKFTREIAEAEPQQAQLLMAKITGNFKHGNER